VTPEEFWQDQSITVQTKVKTLEEVLSLPGAKPCRSGTLKYVNADCFSLDSIWQTSLCRKLNKLFPAMKVNYYPDMSDYNVLLVPDDVTDWNRALVKRMRRQKGLSIVVQHGYPAHRYGYTPLVADYIACWEESRDRLASWGIAIERLLSFTPQPPARLKRLPGIESVFFPILPCVSGNPEFYYDDKECWRTEQELIDIAGSIWLKDSDVLVKPHPKGQYNDPAWKGFRTTYANSDDLIHSADRIYCFHHSTIRKDAEVQGKKVILV